MFDFNDIDAFWDAEEYEGDEAMDSPSVEPKAIHLPDHDPLMSEIPGNVSDQPAFLASAA